MPNIRSGASMTHEEIEDLVTHRVAEEIEAREAVMNLECLNENGDEQENGNRGNEGNGNGGNEGNRNGGNEGNGVHRVQVIEGVQGEQGHRIVRVESAVTALTERVAELERDNRRLRGTASV
nr:hypothetical protein [Tanacetum cinerariifolium]